MTPSEAKNLLETISTEWPPYTPLPQWIKSTYTPGIRDGIVKKNSWQGRIAHFLHQKQSHKHLVKTVFDQLANALLLSHKAPLPLLFKAKLYEALANEGALPTGAPHLVSDCPEIEELEQLRSKEAAAFQQKARTHSHLHHAHLHPETASETKNLDLLFSDTTLPLSVIAKYLQQRPGVCRSTFASQLKKMKAAETLFTEIEEELSRAASYGKDAFHLQLKTSAKKIADQVEEASSFMAEFSYGQKTTPLQRVHDLLRKSPLATLETADPFLKQILEWGSLPSLNEFLEKIFQELRISLTSPCQTAEEEKKREALFQSLLSDPSRANFLKSGPLSYVLPKFMTTRLGSLLEAGVLGTAHKFTEDTRFDSIIQAILEKSAALKNPMTREEALKELQESIATLILQPEKQSIQRSLETFHDMLQSSLKSIPMEIKDLLSLDLIDQSGTVLIDHQRQSNGAYDLYIFASGKATQFHPKDPESGNPLAAICFKGVKKEQLNAAFYERLLFHTHAGLIDKGLKLEAEDVYKGVLATLEVSSQEAQMTPFQPLHNATPATLKIAALTLPNASPDLLLFQLRFSAFCESLKPYLKGDPKTLLIESKEILSTVKHFLKKIERDQKFFTKEIHITCQEVRYAIEKAEQSFEKNFAVENETGLQLPPKVLLHLKNSLAKIGIKTKHLRAYQGHLTWALGDEFGEVISALSDEFEKLPDTAPTGEDKKKGWLLKYLSSVYWNIASYALTGAILYLRFGYRGVLLGAAIPFAAEQLSPYLPSPILDWYADMLSLLKRKIGELFCSLVVNFLYTQEDKDKLHAWIEEQKQGVKAKSIALFAKQEILELAPFQDYLVLQNEGNHRQVVIEDKKWTPLLVSKWAQEYGFFGTEFTNLITAHFHTPVSKTHVYDVTEEGFLISQNPESLGYLAAIYLIQGKTAAALRVLHDLEKLMRKQPLDGEIRSFLFLSGWIQKLPEHFKPIRRRLLAALEYNRTLFQNAPEKPSLFENIGTVLGSFIALEENCAEKNPIHQLSNEDEWLLFQSFFFHSKNLMLSLNPENTWMKKGVDTGAWDLFFSLFGMSKPLFDRYEKLCRVHAPEEGTLHAFIRHTLKNNDELLTSTCYLNPSTYLCDFQHQEDGALGTAAELCRSLGVNRRFFIENLDFTKLSCMEKELQTPLSENPENYSTYFLTYFAIARGDFGQEPKNALEKQLQLYQGGIDRHTGALIYCLQGAIAAAPLPFLLRTPDELKSALCLNKNLAPFFEDLFQTAARASSLQHASSLLKAAALKFQAFRMLSNPSGIATTIALKVLQHSFVKLDQLLFPQKITQERAPAPSETSFSKLQLIDHKFDLLLQVPENDLAEFQHTLKAALFKLKSLLKEQKKTLLKLLGGRDNPYLTMEDLHAFFRSGTLKSLGPAFQVPGALLERLDYTLAKFAVESSRAHQIETVISLLDKLFTLDSGAFSAAYGEIVKTAGLRRAYNLSSKEARRYLHLELSTRTMLQKDNLPKEIS